MCSDGAEGCLRYRGALLFRGHFATKSRFAPEVPDLFLPERLPDDEGRDPGNTDEQQIRPPVKKRVWRNDKCVEEISHHEAEVDDDHADHAVVLDLFGRLGTAPGLRLRPG